VKNFVQSQFQVGFFLIRLSIANSTYCSDTVYAAALSQIVSISSKKGSCIRILLFDIPHISHLTDRQRG
jgi:hypothetical protein